MSRIQSNCNICNCEMQIDDCDEMICEDCYKKSRCDHEYIFLEIKDGYEIHICKKCGMENIPEAM